MGTVRWQNALCHLFCWIMIYLITIKGTKVAGKVVYFTATAPYVLLIALLSYGLYLPGSDKGIEYFLVPQWEELLNYNVWVEAAIQVMYQGAAAWGGLITLSSFNKFDHKVYRDAWLVPTMSLLTSILGGCAIFSNLGFMAHNLGKNVSEVAKSSGPGLAFVVYPSAIAQMNLSPLWAILFFLTLITVGIDTQFGLFETLTSGLIDSFSLLRKHQFWTKTLCAVILYLSGLPFCTNVSDFLNLTKYLNSKYFPSTSGWNVFLPNI